MRRAGVLFCLTLAGCGGVASDVKAEALPPVTATGTGAVDIGGDSVELVTDGQAAVDRLLAAVSGASQEVDAEIYEFDRPDLVDAMVAARQRGVVVVVIVDPTVDVNIATAARLRAVGGTVLFFPDATLQIDHVKLLVADHRRAIFGGMNWGRGSFLNHDFDLVVSGGAVAHLDSIFEADRVRAGQATVHPTPPPPDPAGLRLLTTYPENQVQPAVLEAIGAARRTVFVEMYVLTDGQVMSALGAAARRGVGVWILFDPNQELNQAAAARLRQAGVAVRFYHTRGEKLHAKAMVVDGHALVVGSANWTSSGFTRNHELDAAIESPGLAALALAGMEADWRASA